MPFNSLHHKRKHFDEPAAAPFKAMVKLLKEVLPLTAVNNAAGVTVLYEDR